MLLHVSVNSYQCSVTFPFFSRTPQGPVGVTQSFWDIDFIIMPLIFNMHIIIIIIMCIIMYILKIVGICIQEYLYTLYSSLLLYIHIVHKNTCILYTLYSTFIHTLYTRADDGNHSVFESF